MCKKLSRNLEESKKDTNQLLKMKTIVSEMEKILMALIQQIRHCNRNNKHSETPNEIQRGEKKEWKQNLKSISQTHETILRSLIYMYWNSW